MCGSLWDRLPPGFNALDKLSARKYGIRFNRLYRHIDAGCYEMIYFNLELQGPVILTNRREWGMGGAGVQGDRNWVSWGGESIGARTTEDGKQNFQVGGNYPNPYH